MIKTYICPWCNENFKKDVHYVGKRITNRGEVVHGFGKKSSLSTQVICPKCGRCIPTFKKEETGNLVGRKHIHLRS